MRLILLLLLGLVMADLADAQRGRRRSRVIRGTYGEVLNRNGDFFAAVGGSPASAVGPNVDARALPFGVYEITLRHTGTGWQERFLIGVPTNPIVPAPLLTVFHGYGEEPVDLVYKTSYFQEAMARGWIVIAPLGAHKFNYSIDYAQTNVEKAIDWAATFLTLDIDRFYAVGFSMGGGMAATFGARHLDPLGPRFAAVAVHTGTCSMRDVYWSANDKSLLESPLMFGATPDLRPFRYQVASAIDLDTVSDTVDPAASMVRNLAHAPLFHFAAVGDPNAFLVNETEKDHDQALLAGGTSTYTTSGDTVHKWSTLDETAVLDWLEPLTFQPPAADAQTEVLADRSGRWFDVYVRLINSTAFAPLRWTSVAAQNRAYIDKVENADLISVDPDKIGLSKASTLELVFNNTDGQAIDLVLEGYTQAPSDVKRNGQSTGSWTYDPVEGTVTLIETNGAAWPLWSIIP